MSDQVMVRLAINGESVRQDLDKALAPLVAGAEKAGLDAGKGLASGIARASGEIESAASTATKALDEQTAAMARFGPLAASYASAKARMTAETADLRVALKAGEISQEQYNLAVIEGGAALKAQAVQLRAAEKAYLDTFRASDAVADAAGRVVVQQRNLNDVTGQNRAGLQQLGYQLGDVATMFSLGASPAQIFGSQIGQVTQAVQMMSGGTSRLAAFLGGPWGIAISTAAIALSPFIARLFDTEEAADGARSALEELASARQAATAAMTLDARAQGELNDLIAREAELRAAIQRQSGGRLHPDGTPMFSYREYQELLGVQEQIESAQLDLSYRRAQLDADRLRSDQARERQRAARPPSGTTRADSRAATVAPRQSEEERAAERQTESTQRFIETMRQEIATMGLSAEAIQQLEVERQMAAARTDEERAQIDALNQQRLEAITLIKREADARRTAEAVTAKKQDALEEMKARNADIAEDFRRQQEDVLRDISYLYEDLFSGRTDRIWKDFKQQGIAVLADIAAQWTLSLLSGQSSGGGRPGNPLAGLFGSALGGGGGSGGLLGAILGSGGGAAGGGKVASAAAGGSIFGGGGLLGPGLLATPAAPMLAGIAAGTIAGPAIADLLGIKYSKTAGLFGILPGIIGGLFKKDPKGSASLTGLDGANITSRGSGMADNVSSLAGSVQDQIAQIAAALGVDVGAFSVSIGQRKDQFRVAGSAGIDAGQKNTAGFLYTGGDAEQAVMVAVRDAISDGALKGISAASQKILAAGGDLEKAIEKAVLIESVPRLLKARLDPLGAALDEIDAKFGKLADALREGGASAEQVAQARQLWQLEREDALKQIGAASASLKDFLLSLTAGSNSPLSLRQQKAEAEAALAPFVQKIEAARSAQAEVDRLKAGGGSAAEIAAAQEAARTAAAGVDQQGFQNAAQLLLGISRQMDASGAGFFADFDRIRSLTGGAIGAIDGAATVPGAGRDPFAQLTANNTATMSNQLTDMTRLLSQIATTLATNDNYAADFSWLNQNRQFV